MFLTSVLQFKTKSVNEQRCYVLKNSFTLFSYSLTFWALFSKVFICAVFECRNELFMLSLELGNLS